MSTGDLKQSDAMGELHRLSGALRARLETERWFGISHIYMSEQLEANASVKRCDYDANSVEASGTGDSNQPEMPGQSKSEMLQQLAEIASECSLCGLSETRKNLVFGEGNPDARIMFIGEAPGRDEDIKARPFVGRAGQLLDKIIAAMGLRREDVYIANILKCRPPNNRNPNPQEIEVCMPTLLKQIEIIRPGIIIALGAVSACSLLDMKGSLGSMRGRIHDFNGTKLVVTYHPAYLLRNPDAKRQVWEDVKMAMAELGLKPPEIQSRQKS